MADKNYVGKGWAKHIDQYDSDLLNISLKIEDLQKLPVNEYGDIRLTVVERKEKDEKSGATHYVIEDDYQPGNGKDMADQAPQVTSENKEEAPAEEEQWP